MKSYPTKANIGCGVDYREGWFNVDVTPEVKTDLCHSLDTTPWPIPDNTFDEVLMQGVLEHLYNTIPVVKEIHRILKPGGVWRGSMPYCFSMFAFRDPTHVRYFDDKTFDYFMRDISWTGGVLFEKRFVKLTTYNDKPIHKMRNLIPFRGLLRHVLINMYDSIEWELVKPFRKGINDSNKVERE
jgi:SAM-dependent methyltransferase